LLALAARELFESVAEALDASEIAGVHVGCQIQEGRDRRQRAAVGGNREQLGLLAVALRAGAVTVEQTQHAAHVQTAHLRQGFALHDLDPVFGA
jgi:hypothetical protein